MRYEPSDITSGLTLEHLEMLVGAVTLKQCYKHCILNAYDEIYVSSCFVQTNDFSIILYSFTDWRNEMKKMHVNPRACLRKELFINHRELHLEKPLLPFQKKNGGKVVR